MCRVLGQDFVPYLPAVMPPLLKLATAKADIQLLEDEENVAQIEQEEGWELVPLKGKYIGIKTSTLDDKFMALIAISLWLLNAKRANVHSRINGLYDNISFRPLIQLTTSALSATTRWRVSVHYINTSTLLNIT